MWEDFTKQYEKYFKSNEDLWIEMLSKVKIYIDNNKKRPSQQNEDKNIKKLGMWIQHQQNNYPKNLKIMEC